MKRTGILTSTGILMYADVAIISMLHTLRLVLLVT